MRRAVIQIKEAYNKLDNKSKTIVKQRIAIVVIIIMLSSIAAVFQTAYADATQLQYRYDINTQTICVSDGMTLHGIAERYKGQFPGTTNDYIMVLCKRNKIFNADKIYAGMELKVPIYTSTEDPHN